MGTLATALDNVRLRIKDQYKTEFTDEDLIVLASEVMEQIHETLCHMQSNLVISTTTFDTASGVSDYTLSGVTDIISGTIWIDSETPLELLMTPIEDTDNAQPLQYTILPSGDIRLTPTPDGIYTVSYTYCESFTVPTVAVLSTYDFPWDGLWDRAIMRTIVLECLTILERAIGVAAAQSRHAWDEALLATYNRGIIRRTRKGRMFV